MQDAAPRRSAVPMELSRAALDRAREIASTGGFLLARLVLLPLVACLPPRRAFAVARWRGRRRYRRLAPEVKARMRRDIQLALGPIAESEIEAILQEGLEILSCDELDVFCYARAGRRGFTRLVEVQGIEHLDWALQRGRGALLFSGHFGGAQGLLGALAARGYPLFGIVRAFHRDPWAQRVVFAWKTRWLERVQNGPVLFAGQGSAERALARLREGKVGWVIIDAPPGKSRRVVDVEFLGQACRLSYGLIELAETAEAPILPFFVYYTAPHLRRAVIGPPVPLSTATDLEASRHDNLRRCLARIEAAIAEAPSHWMLWGHFESLWRPAAAGSGGAAAPVSRAAAAITEPISR